jgi:hypothetical protein
MGFENGKLVRVTLRATKGTREEVNTFHYDLQDDTGEPANDPQSLANYFRDHVTSLWGGLYKSGWTIQPVEVVQERDPLDPGAARSEWSAGTPFAGTKASGSTGMPSGTCVLVRLLTANIGRRARGRIFFGGDANQSSAAGNDWISSYITYIQSIVDAIPVAPDLTDLTSTSSAHWCVYSRTQRAEDRDPYAPGITAKSIQTPVHWLRRRAGIA